MTPLDGSTTKQKFGGAIRSRSPGDTLELITPYFERIGLTRLANVTGLDFIGIPTVQAIRPNARSLSVSQGKGVTLELAKVSAAMEALELFHAERPNIELRLGTLWDMESSCDVVDLEDLARAFRQPSPETRTLWTRGVDLVSERELWLPYGCVSMDMTVPLLEASDVYPPSSNGLASGNSLSEATLHALLEVVERDAYTLFFTRAPEHRDSFRIDLSSVADETCCGLLALLLDAGMAVATWDITSDIGIPVYLCAVLDARPNFFRNVGVACGSGAHLDPTIALARALTEAAQARLTRIAGSRDSMTPETIASIRQRTASASFDVDELASGPMSFRAAPLSCGDTFEADLTFVVEELRRRDIKQVVAVDLSQQTWPVSVARVIVPKLESLIDAPAYRPGPRARELAELTS